MATRLLLVLSAVLASVVLGTAAPASISGDCVSGSLIRLTGVNVYPASHQIYSTQVQYANDRTTVQVANNFNVTYYSTFKVVTARFNATLSETYLLYQCGTPVPSADSLGLPASTKTFSVPLTAIAAPDTSVLHFMKMLGILDRVTYVTEYAVDPCMQYLAGNACNHTAWSAPADAVNAKFAFDPSANPSSIMFRATADPGPLNRAEYIKFVATFFNREAAANVLFSKVAEAYDNVKRQVADYLAGGKGSSPLVAWLYYSAPYDDGVWKLPESISVKFAKYRKLFTTDAGGRLHDLAQLEATYVDGTNVVAGADELLLYNLNGSVSSAALKAILKDVDIVIDESYYATPSDMTLDLFRQRYHLTDPADLAAYKFFQAPDRVVRLDAQATNLGSTGWYEQAVARPDLFLRDLSQVFLPGSSLTYSDSAAPHMVRALALPASSSAATPLLSSTVQLVAASQCPASQQRCTGTPQPICPAVYLDCSGKLVTATDAQPCAPQCPVGGTNNNGGGGAAGRAVLAPGLLLALATLALAAVICHWF